jgi:dTMP kinase
MDGDGTGGSRSGDGVLPSDASAAYRALARNRPYRNLMLATGTSALGDWIGFLAIIALTSEILGPTRAALFAVSGVMIARVVPSLLLGPVAGVFVDRWDRKRVMIVTDIARGTVMALIPFTDEVLTLVLATLVIEVMSALFAPAKDAVLPTLVKPGQLVAANQINLLTTYGTLPLGAALYSVLLARAIAVAPEGSFLEARPLALPIWFNALSFYVSAPLLATLTFPRQSAQRAADPRTTPGAWEQLKEGLRFVGGHPVIRALILGVMIAFAAAGVVITVGEAFSRLLNAGPSGYGVLVAVVGVGLVIGLVGSGPLTRRVAPERLFAPGIGLAGAALVVTASMPNLLATVPSALVMGAGAGLSFIVGYTVLQQRSDDRIRGRTFGAFNSGVRVAIFGSAIAAPAVIGVLGRERVTAIVLEGGGVEIAYPYVFGGIRLTLIGAGLLAMAGAVLTGRSLARALQAEASRASLHLEPPGGAHPEAHPEAPAGLFVVFEGGDGAGKSTQIRLLRAAIERSGREVVVTREPGGTALGERIREQLLSHASDGMSDRAEALLYAAARAEHVDEVIRPALAAGKVVLCDRFVDSSVVYQGAGRGLGEEQVAELNRWATAGVVPALVVLLDLDPEDGLRRAVGDGHPDRLEAAGLEFHRAVRAAYLRRADAHPERTLVLDASRPVEELHAEIRAAVLQRIAPPPATPVEEPRRSGEHADAAAPEAGDTEATDTDPAGTDAADTGARAREERR